MYSYYSWHEKKEARICLNLVKYFSYLDIVFLLGPAVSLYGISTVLFLTVLDYPCRRMHSQRAPCYTHINKQLESIPYEGFPPFLSLSPANASFRLYSGNVVVKA